MIDAAHLRAKPERRRISFRPAVNFCSRLPYFARARFSEMKREARCSFAHNFLPVSLIAAVR
jgi:hypothetical protein